MKVAIYDDYEGEYDECPGEGYAEDCYQVAMDNGIQDQNVNGAKT